MNKPFSFRFEKKKKRKKNSCREERTSSLPGKRGGLSSRDFHARDRINKFPLSTFPSYPIISLKLCASSQQFLVSFRLKISFVKEFGEKLRYSILFEGKRDETRPFQPVSLSLNDDVLAVRRRRRHASGWLTTWGDIISVGR